MELYHHPNLRDHPEYQEREAQLQASNDTASLRTLRLVYDGLESVIGKTYDESLQFRKLTMLSPQDIKYFEGKTIYEALTSQDVGKKHLLVLKEYGKRLANIGGNSSHLPGRAKEYGINITRLGILIYLLAVAQAYNRFNTAISSRNTRDLRIDLKEFQKRKYVVPSLALILESCLTKIPRYASFLGIFRRKSRNPVYRMYY